MKDAKSKCCGGKLSICNLGFALGTAWGLSLFILVAFSMSSGVGTPILRELSSLYYGYHASFTGAFWGLLMGFIHGFFAGAFIAGVYNHCRCWCPCKSCKTDRCNM